MLPRILTQARLLLENLSLLKELSTPGKIDDQHWKGLSCILLISIFAVICATFLDYGLTWDEDAQRTYGDFVLKWYSSFFQDRSALNFLNLYLYGGFFEAVAQLATRIAPLGVYETRHLVNAVFGFLGLVGAYKLGAHLAGAVGGFFSALFLTLTPGFYGHLFNNPKDIPFAVLFLFSVYFLFKTYDILPYISKGLIITLGISIGLTSGVRVAGIVLVFYQAILWITWITSQCLFSPLSARISIFRTERMLLIFYLSTVILAWIVMLIWWPWAQTSPLFNVVSALREIAHFKWDGMVFFNRQFFAATELPWSYLPTWLAISLPEFYFIILLGGFCNAIIFLVNFEKTEENIKALVKIGFIIFMICFPIISAILLHSTVYDGMRQFLFVVPLLSVLLGVSFVKLLCSNCNPLIKKFMISLIILSGILTIVDMLRLHPYQSIYFNRIVAGGMKAGSVRFETDYWGSAHKEGAEWLIKHNYSNSSENIRVANCAVPVLSGYVFEKLKGTKRRFTTVTRDENPHIVLATTRWKCHELISGKILHIVERMDVPLLYVIEVIPNH